MDCWLSDNDIGEEGTKVVSGALKKNTTLTSLNLESEENDESRQNSHDSKNNLNHLKDNHIRTHGAKALSEALKINTTLTILNLSSEQQSHHGESRERVG